MLRLPSNLSQVPAFAARVLSMLICAWIEVLALTSIYVVQRCLDWIWRKDGNGKSYDMFGKKLDEYTPRFPTPKDSIVYKKSSPDDTYPIHEVDQQATLSTLHFPISAKNLIKTTEQLLASDFEASRLSSDFTFLAPVVGPLTKKDFCFAYNSFRLRKAVPDLVTLT